MEKGFLELGWKCEKVFVKEDNPAGRDAHGRCVVLRVTTGSLARFKS